MRLRVSIFASIIALLLGAFSIGGATMAWLTAGSDTMENTFNAGTVSFVLGGPIPGTEVEGCLPVEWQIAYTGSKKAYLRVRPFVEAEEIETIYIAIHAVMENNQSYWAQGIKIEPGVLQNWYGHYFEYTLNVLKQVYLQRGNEQAGQVDISYDSNNDNLNFYFNLTSSPRSLSKFDIYVGLIPPNTHDYTTYPYRVTLTEPLKVYNYSIPLAPYLDSGGSVDVQLCNQIDLWVMDNDGWWYYNRVVNPGDLIGVCFEFCVNPGYTGNISYYLEAEAVQASHGAIDVLWPNRGWNPPNPP